MPSARAIDFPTSQSLQVRPFRLPPALVLCAIGIAAILLVNAYAWRHGALFLVGVVAGIVLYHAAFGFTSAWRRVIVGGSGEGLRAQMLMLALTSVVFFPVLARGEILGQAVNGAVAPIGVSVVAGAFLFGIGMQLGGGCASGTLYSSGGGNLRMLVTLAAFIAGSVAGAHDMPFWDGTPAYAPVSLVDRFGAGPALAASLVLFALIAGLSLAIDRWRDSRVSVHEGLKDPRLDRIGHDQAGWRVLRGPWPFVAGAVGLAVVNIATLVLAGRPWGVTSAFALWGSKLLASVGVNVAAWPYWQTAVRAADLQASVFHDVTSVMDFGIMLGALAAAAFAGRFAPTWRVPGRSVLAAVFGGLMLGYGARIAYGCNIGAFFSGVVSSSLHGWLWFVAAFVGNAAGTRLRPVFGLGVS